MAQETPEPFGKRHTLNVSPSSASPEGLEIHVASDIGTDQLFLDTSNLKTQSNITELEHWTETNKTNKAYNEWRVDGEAKNYQTSGGLVG